jgi:molybdopterin molybdotransferase
MAAQLQPRPLNCGGGHRLCRQGLERAGGAGECVKIMTGAIMPAGLDTVVPHRVRAQVEGETVTVPAGVVRPATTAACWAKT